MRTDLAPESTPLPPSTRWQRSFYWVTLATGLILCLAAYAFFRHQRERRIAAEFDRCMDQHCVELSENLRRYQTQLLALRALFDYSDDVTRAEFAGAARELQGELGASCVLEWVPRVLAEERASVEAAARAAGLLAFEFRERGPQGELRRAAARPEYWPIFYVEPPADNGPAFGYDLLTGPTVRELAVARDRGEMVASPPISLVQAAHRADGWVLALPVYRHGLATASVAERRERLAGFLQGVFRLDEFFGRAWGNSYTNEVDLLVVDRTDSTAPRALFLRGRGSAGELTAADFDRPGAGRRDWSVLGRRWELLFRPTSQWDERTSSWSPEAFFAMSLFGLGVLALNLRSQQRSTRLVEDAVAAQTVQLRRVNTELVERVEEQRRTYDQLVEVRETRERLAAAVEQASEMIYFCNEHGAICYVNPAFSRLTGYADTEVLGQGFAFVYGDPATGASFAAVVEEVARGGSWRGAFPMRQKDGGTLDVEVAVSAARDPARSALNYVVIARDVTKEARLEEQVRLSQKMEAIGLLAGGVAHDFNNLLQVIQGFTVLAMDPAAEPTEQRESLEQVQLAVERATRLTRQLLAFGRRQPLSKEDIDLNLLLRDLLKMIRRILGEHIQIDLIPGHQLGNVRADRSQIEQVVLNLCVNARDAMPHGGRLTLELETVLVNGSYRESHPWAKPGRYVLISIMDTGVGMDKATQARIFEPFFTTKSKERGTGLGLSVVYGIVKQHDGMVHVYSEVGLGSTFKVYLPVVERAAVEVGAKLAPAPRQGHETILLVEDEAAVRTLAEKILRKAGYQVLLADDGLEACQVFEEHAAEISLVLMDVVMPHMGGREAYQRISARRPGVAVIYCSGYSQGALHEGFELPEGLVLIQKPYAPDDLLAKIRVVLDGLPPRPPG